MKFATTVRAPPAYLLRGTVFRDVHGARSSRPIYLASDDTATLGSPSHLEQFQFKAANSTACVEWRGSVISAQRFGANLLCRSRPSPVPTLHFLRSDTSDLVQFETQMVSFARIFSRELAV